MSNHKGVKVYDNGGKTFDRYTVVIDGDVYGIGDTPRNFNQFCFSLDKGINRALDMNMVGKAIAIQDLPTDVIQAICDRMKGEE